MSKPEMGLSERNSVLEMYRCIDKMMKKHAKTCPECRINDMIMYLCADITVPVMAKLRSNDITVMEVFLSGAPMDGTVLQCITNRLCWGDNANELDDTNRG